MAGRARIWTGALGLSLGLFCPELHPESRAARAEEAGLIPHRALYALEDQGGGAAGRYAVEYDDRCGRWIWRQDTRMLLSLKGMESAVPMALDIRVDEARDGSASSFVVWAGDGASSGPEGGPGRPSMVGEARPGERLSMNGAASGPTLPGDAVLSAAWLDALSRAAARGETRLRRTLFIPPPAAGMAATVIMDAVTEISPDEATPQEKAAFGEILEGRRVWRAKTLHWTFSAGDGPPLHEAEERIAEGGLVLGSIWRMEMATIGARLRELELRAPQECPQETP
ncbi:DUF1849 family protein [Neomegalonema sp.]|uniref:EipB family protein n=1 Tax=Neomegalonema sp. TaxID=2039713 RepID=UPI002605B950|nr:DUF1849 family protein [Neomegalonema sp.]MDD2870193.1 DUF1849 family protein [Neomegalonema sp.]